MLQEFAVFIVQTFSSFLDGAFAVHHGIIKNRYIKEAFTKLSEVECFKKVLTRLGIYTAFLKINIDIFGSCVCRDVFNHPNDKFNVVHYINGCSPFSITSPKYENICVKPDDLSLKSNFERRSTCIDVNKSYMEFFEVGTNNSDYLIIDLSDSRLSLGQTMLNNSTQNYILSYGTTFMENYKKDFLNGKFKNISLQKVNALRISDGEWKEAIRRYCDYIASMNYKKVIVVESYCALSYYDAENGIRTDFDNVDYLMELNSLFKKLYAYLREYMPQAVFVGFSGEFVGFKQHKLGLYPLHFTNEIYEHICKDIEKAITC